MWRSPTGGAREAGRGQSAAGSTPMPSSSSQFADQSGLGQFARFDLAAGKLPQSRHRPAGRALLEQNPARAVDQRRRHHHHCRIFLQTAALSGRTPLTTLGLFATGKWALMPTDRGIKAMRRFLQIFRDQRGATAVEYGLILALIFLAMIGALLSVATDDDRDVELRFRSGQSALTQIALNLWKLPP